MCDKRSADGTVRATDDATRSPAARLAHVGDARQKKQLARRGPLRVSYSAERRSSLLSLSLSLFTLSLSLSLSIFPSLSHSLFLFREDRRSSRDRQRTRRQRLGAAFAPAEPASGSTIVSELRGRPRSRFIIAVRQSHPPRAFIRLALTRTRVSDASRTRSRSTATNSVPSGSKPILRASPPTCTACTLHQAPHRDRAPSREM